MCHDDFAEPIVAVEAVQLEYTDSTSSGGSMIQLTYGNVKYPLINVFSRLISNANCQDRGPCCHGIGRFCLQMPLHFDKEDIVRHAASH